MPLSDQPPAIFSIQPLLAVEYDRLPHAIKLERFADVVVGGSVIQAGVIGVDLLRVGRGTGVQTLGPGELGIGHKLVREIVLQLGKQGIVVAVALNAPVIAAADLRVQLIAQGRGVAFGFSWN